MLTKFTNLEWYVKYIITYSLATILCVIQIKIVNAIQNQYGNNKLSYMLKYLKG